MADRKSRALFPANGNFVLLDQLADVLEAYWRFVELDLKLLCQSINQVSSGNGFGHAILPAAALHQVIKQQSDHVIRLQKRAILVEDAEAVGVAISGDPDVSAGFAHLLPQSFKQVIV